MRALASILAAATLVLVGAHALGLVVAAQLAHLNSDQLYLPSLYDDLFVDHGSLRDWVLPPAPSFFPDLLLYAIARTLTSAVGLAFLLAVCAQFVLATVLAGVLVRTISASARVPWVEVILSAVVLLVLLAAHPLNHDFFSMTHHGGALAIGLGLAVLWSRIVEGWRARDGVSIGLLVFLGAASDLIFVPQFLAPLCLAGFVLAASRRLAMRQAFRPLLASGAGLALALGVIRFLQTKGSTAGADVRRAAGDAAASEPAEGLFRLAGPVVRERLVDLWCWLGGSFSALLAIALVGAGLVVARTWREPRAPDGDRRLFVSVFFLACMLCTLSAPLATLGADPRYMQPVYFLPTLMLPWLMRALRLRAPLRIASLAAAALVVSIPGRVWAGPLVPRSFRLPYPESVACVDRAAEEDGATYGFASYWYARYTHFHSHRGIHVNELSQELGPRVWISSRAWYAETAAAHPRRIFVVSAGLPVERFAETFGGPLRVTPCPGLDVYTYDYTALSRAARQALGADLQ